MTVRLVAVVSGSVQGVGFRAWVRSRAEPLGLRGRATNLRDGRVEIVAEGERTTCEQLLREVRGPRAPGRVSGVAVAWADPQPEPAGFRTGSR